MNKQQLRFELATLRQQLAEAERGRDGLAQMNEMEKNDYLKARGKWWIEREDLRAQLSASQAEVERLTNTKTLLEESLGHRLTASEGRVAELQSEHETMVNELCKENAKLVRELARAGEKTSTSEAFSITAWSQIGSRISILHSQGVISAGATISE